MMTKAKSADSKLNLINGSLLSANKGKEVVIFGKILSKTPKVRGITIKTTDERFIRVEANQAVEKFEIGVWMQVTATVMTENLLKASLLVVSSGPNASEMDCSAYNELIKIHTAHGKRYL